jgi:hypothetical protein
MIGNRLTFQGKQSKTWKHEVGPKRSSMWAPSIHDSKIVETGP